MSMHHIYYLLCLSLETGLSEFFASSHIVFCDIVIPDTQFAPGEPSVRLSLLICVHVSYLHNLSADCNPFSSFFTVLCSIMLVMWYWSITLCGSLKCLCITPKTVFRLKKSLCFYAPRSVTMDCFTMCITKAKLGLLGRELNGHKSMP